MTTSTPARVKRARDWTPARAAQYGLMILAAAFAVFPLYWMLASSLKPAAELQQLPPTWWPIQPILDAYSAVFQVIPFARAIANSFIIAGGTTLGIVVTSLMAGYVFAKYRFRGREVLFFAVLATMFVPPIVLLVPLYRMMQGLGLVDTHLGVMLPFLANAFGIFLMRQFIAGVPDELIDAARIDGASEATVLFRIVAPLVAPGLAVLILFAFVFHWNSFLWPLTMLQSQDMQTVVLAMNSLMSYTTSVRFQNVVMAGATISILPSVLLFLVLGRYFVRGILQTGLRG
jgi:multiple sugar transport system permease protein